MARRTYDGVRIHSQRCRLWLWPAHCQYVRLVAARLHSPLGRICLIDILVCGWLSAHFPSIRISLLILILNCLPVIAGCVMIWKSSWKHHAPTPVAGYSIIGAFGAVVSLTICVGMVNVAGITKKSAMAVAIFIAYCVGNIVGPQLIKSQTKARHYPELWEGLIIW